MTEFNLTDQEKTSLLQLARDSISAELKNEQLPTTELGFKKAGEPAAAFVTIHKQGQLRGCIGYIEAVKPLAISIQEMALSAAFKDPRFNPVVQEELEKLDIEISVLSPMRKIDSVDEIEVGKHGLFIVQGFNSGLLLPQVPTEIGWDREQFLEGVCQKAGLPNDAWQKGAMLNIFTAEIFHEQSA